MILYADRITGSMARAIEETKRRRGTQMAYNREHGIVPVGIKKDILPGIEEEIRAAKVVREVVREGEANFVTREKVQDLERRMPRAAAALDFELAAELRDRIKELEGSLGSPAGNKM